VIDNVLLLALIFVIAFEFLLMYQLKFLTPYRQAIIRDYGWAIGLYAVLLLTNLFAAFLLIVRKFFLKHTGPKLVYVDKRLRIGKDDLASQTRERSQD
jgi:hypothetical protein